MARPPRVVVPGGTYNLGSRGNSQELIFVDGHDRHYFLKLLKKTIEKYGWVCLAYCLLGNHYHLLIKIDETNLSRGMQWLLWRYALYFNRRHGRLNHVVGERFYSDLVENEAHLLRVICYFALNPVKAGLVERPEDWMWQSYGPTIGVGFPHSVLSVDALLACVDGDPERARRRIRTIVEAELATHRAAQKGHVPVTVTGT